MSNNDKSTYEMIEDKLRAAVGNDDAEAAHHWAVVLRTLADSTRL